MSPDKKFCIRFETNEETEWHRVEEDLSGKKEST